MTTTHSIKALKKFHEVINNYIDYALNHIDFSYYNYNRNIDLEDDAYEYDYKEELNEEIFNVLFNGWRPDIFNHNFSWFLHHHSNYKPTALAYHAVIFSVKKLINEYEDDPRELLGDLIMEHQSATMNKLAYFYHRHTGINTDKINQVVNDMFMELQDKTRTTGKECVICYDDCVIEHMCQTCKHSMVCRQCYSRLNKRCPLCRTTMVIPPYIRIGTWRIKVNHLQDIYNPVIGGSLNYYYDTLKGIREYNINTLKRVEIRIGKYSYMSNICGDWIVISTILDKHKSKRNSWGSFDKKADYHHTINYHHIEN